MHQNEPCCAACRFWSPEYEPTDYVLEQAPDLPVFNGGTRGWCLHGGRKQGENVNRDDIAGTYWESAKTGLITKHDTCCANFRAGAD